MRIDSHQHFWQYNPTDYVWMSEAHSVIRRDFLPEDLQPILEAGNIGGTIAVQARQQIEETDFLLELADQNELIKGVVGWIPFCDKGAADYIATYAQHRKIVGFRHVLHDEPDDNFMLRPDFTAGIQALSRFPLCYDLLIFERHLPQSIVFVDKYPSLSIIVDHIAKPRIRRNEFDHAWAKNIRLLGERDHVCCKLSGLVTEVRDASWDTELLQPYFDTVLDAFGADRLLYGSDWPVCLLRSEYLQWVTTVSTLIEKLSLSEQAAIMGGNAARVYLKNQSGRYTNSETIQAE
ncbi:MAG: amidohydrolase [Sediminibacterium sp.]|nr:amidohydrolase [Sediminibacterium sp.]